jgi:branched-chain amino acid transport system substrate-binding protein
MAVLEAAMAAALAVALVGCGPGKAAQPEKKAEATGEPIKIGVVVSLTGTYAGLGEPEKNTLEMEMERINKDGGIKGRPIELLFEDDATDDAQSNAAASKLIDQEQVVAIIGATGTGGSMAMRDVIKRAGVPQVSMAGGTVITNPVESLVYATPWSNKIVAPFELADMKKAGITKVGLISDSGGFGKDGRAVFLESAKAAGVQVVKDETFNAGDADMTAQLTRIKSSGAQALVLWNAGKEASTVLKNAQSLGMSMPIYGSHGNARREFISGAGDAAEGVKFAAGKILIPETYGEDTKAYRVATDFVSRYQERFGQPPSTFAGHAYDALYLIVEAARGVDGELTPAALAAQLEKTDGFVGIGGTFKFSPTDHNGLSEKDLTMYEVRNGAWVVAK